MRIPSPIGEESAAQREVDRTMRRIGLVTDVFDIDRHGTGERARICRGGTRDYANRPCVVGTLKGEGGGRSITLNAHIDTAPVDASAVDAPPFSGHIEGDRFMAAAHGTTRPGSIEILLIVEAFKRPA